MSIQIQRLACLHGMPSSTIWDDYKYFPIETEKAINDSLKVL